MDLLATVRKEGTRGGTGDFKWSDVQSSSHREHYLGHSLMAPVGRWQKNRDLNWYAKSDAAAEPGEDPEQRAARERKEEIRRVKEAEEDALARALGLPVPDRTNANLEALGTRKEVDLALKDVVGRDGIDSGRGLGFGNRNNLDRVVTGERIEGDAEAEDREMQHALREYKRRHGDVNGRTKRRAHSRSRSRERDRHGRHHRDSGRDKERDRSHHHRSHHRGSSRDRDRRHSRSRSTSRNRRRHDKPRDRSRSPYRSRRVENETRRGRE